MRTRKVLFPRPEEAPADWEIYNAPRPLAGHENWQGEWLAGVFYAAVDPTATDYAVMKQRNADLDATRLVYVTEDEVVAEMVTYYQSQQPKVWERLAIDPTDLVARARLVQAWYGVGLNRPQNGDEPVAATIEAKLFGSRRQYTSLGVGAYPYECKQQDDHPTAVIYYDAGKGAWIASVDLGWSDAAGCYVYKD